MATMQRRITRGPWISELDARFGGTPDNFLPNYADALRRLQAGNGQQESMQALATARVGADAAQHFSDDWLGNWWPEAQPIEPILRAGLIEAFKKGLSARLPMSALWVQATEDQFEVGISQNSHQITLLILTPPAPADERGVSEEPSDVTLVSREGGKVVVDPPT